jgi:uncharacterized protein (TIGR04255 family)
MVNVPVSLDRDTIFECVAEMRFSEANESAEDLIPGLVFGRLRRMFQKSVQQPFAQLPKQLRDHDSNLRYQPTHLLEGDGIRLLLGARMAAVAFARPYMGWAAVKPLIIQCFEGVLETEMVKAVERVSLKYTNLLAEGRNESDISQLVATVDLGGMQLRGPGLEIKAEIERNDCITIVQIASNVSARSATPLRRDRVSRSEPVAHSRPVLPVGDGFNGRGVDIVRREL